MEQISFPDIFVLLPILTSVVVFAFGKKSDKLAFHISLISSLLLLGIVISSLFGHDNIYHHSNVSMYVWLKFLGSHMVFVADGMSKILCLLTSVVYVVVILISKHKNYNNSPTYFSLLFLMQAGLMGVFMAYDLFLFYFFWELVLIPAYFLVVKWGTENSFRYTFKFYVYTFLGSIIMLVGLIYLYNQSGISFRMELLRKNAVLNYDQQWFFFICFFVALAIKMPLVPFHTWQPNLYKNAPIGVTMVLSAVMVKMGVFAMMRWLIPFVPDIIEDYSYWLTLFAVIGMLYASLIVFRQNDLRKFVSYVSIAHVSLMAAAILSRTQTAYSGTLIHMFHHGVNILGMWMIVDWLETHYNVEKISDIKGLAKKHPFISVVSFIVVLANIAVPLTNGFPGEFLMFLGIFEKNEYIALLAGLTMILGAAYFLVAFGKIFFENDKTLIAVSEKTFSGFKLYRLSFSLIVTMILVFGFYPQLFIHLTKGVSRSLLLAKEFF